MDPLTDCENCRVSDPKLHYLKRKMKCPTLQTWLILFIAVVEMSYLFRWGQYWNEMQLWLQHQWIKPLPEEVPDCFFDYVNFLVPALDIDKNEKIDHDEFILLIDLLSEM